MINKFVSVDGDDFRIGLDFAKVDKERRLVIGFATADSVDKSDDHITHEASVKAFSEWRRNIREMHQNQAVGRAMDIHEDTVFDPKTGSTHRGIVISAYVSKGAPEAWEKVLDGTYTGFSIGGRINEAEKVFDPESGKMIRRVTDYDLVEVSLVDSPMHPLANVLQIVKADGGMASEVEIENVLWCNDCQLAVISKEEDRGCAVCESGMENIGWVENSAEKVEDVRKMVNSHITKISKGGTTVEIENKEAEEAAAENAEEAKAEEVAESAGEQVEKAEEVAETAAEETEGAEAAEETAAAEEAEATAEVAKAEEVETATASAPGIDAEVLAKAVSTAVEAALVKFAPKETQEVFLKAEDLETALKPVRDAIEALTARIEDAESQGAVKKSGDVITKSDKTESFWSGAILSD
jgi:hypothetical protein